jgi:hypothetical protein
MLKILRSVREQRPGWHAGGASFYRGPDRFPAESRPGEFRAQAAAGVQRRSVVLAAPYLAVRAEGAVAEQPGSVDEREEAAGRIGEEGRIG